jgi:hypothetical protein
VAQSHLGPAWGHAELSKAVEQVMMPLERLPGVGRVAGGGRGLTFRVGDEAKHDHLGVTVVEGEPRELCCCLELAKQ